MGNPTHLWRKHTRGELGAGKKLAPLGTNFGTRVEVDETEAGTYTDYVEELEVAMN
jgi:hypothetical protein